MAPRLKKTRNRRKEDEIRSPDGLSLLPDSILAHIFSFLDTKTVIRTSVLSKRYKEMWKLTQRLDFKFPKVFRSYRNNKDALALSRRSTDAESFESYVNGVLQQREHSDLTSFKLSLPDSAGQRFVEDCIDYAAKHKVRNFKICYFGKDNPIALPKLLITSPSLITLNLKAAVSKSIELPTSFLLPSLKELRLQGFEFCNKNFHGELFTGSPGLETLVLKKCSIKPGDELKTLDLNFPKLVNLEIVNWRSPWRCFDEHMITVNAPKLSFFKLQGHIVRFDLVEDFSCLNEACIMLSYPSALAIGNWQRKEKSAEACVGLIRQLRSAKSLSLSLKAIEIISSLDQSRFPTDFIFENVKNIKIAVENEHMERNMPTDRPLGGWFMTLPSDCTFCASKDPKYLLECKSMPEKKHREQVMIPLHVWQFFIESLPSAALFTVELPKESSSK